MKYLRTLIIVIVFGVIFLIARQTYLHFGKGTLSINAKPADASIVVDKQAYTTKNARDISLTPGDHTLIIALDGFNTIEQTISMGWQDTQNVTYKLTPKPFKEIYQNLSPDPTYSNYDAEQAKFFLNNTWAAAYIVGRGETEDISVAVIQRVNGAWKLVLHDRELPSNAQSIMPAEVYNYIKDFKE